MKIVKGNKSHLSSSNITCEINVTPLVDIMLVLLIVFMVTSPMLLSSVNVDLPESKSVVNSPDKDEPLIITVDSKGDIFLHDNKISLPQLVNKLHAITQEKKDSRVFIKGDKKISYGEVINVLTEIYAAGFSKVALISIVKP